MIKSKKILLVLFIMTLTCSLCLSACGGFGKVTVTFDGNGGTLLSGEEIQIISSDGSIDNPPEYDRTGYEFKEWNRPLDNIQKNCTIKAVWSPITYKIAFNGNGGTGDGIDKITAIYDEDVVLPNNTFSRYGYKFVGWSKTIDGDAEYDAGDTVRNLCDEQDEVITLYAVWEDYVNDYKVEHYKQNLENDEYTLVEEDTETKSGIIGSLTQAEKKEYDGFIAQEVNLLTIKENQVVTVKIYYDRNNYRITLNEGEGYSVKSLAENVKHGGSVSFKVDLEDGYKDLTVKYAIGEGVYKTLNPVDEVYSIENITDNLSIKISAIEIDKFGVYYSESEKYTITFDKSVEKGVEANTLITATVIVLDAYDAKDMLFKVNGVSIEKEQGEGLKYKFTVIEDVNIEITDIVKKPEWTVSFDSKGGSEVQDRTVIDGKTLDLSYATKTIKSGYTFVKWVVKGSEEEFTSNTVITENVQLEAVWEINVYNVRYILSGGTYKKSGQNRATYTVEDGFTLPDCTRSYYNFGGWIVNGGSATRKIAVGTTGDLELTAKWIPINYKLNYVYGDVIMPDGYSKNYNIENELTLPVLSREGWTFKGWLIDGKGNPVDKIEIGNHGDKTLVASWDREDDGYYYIIFNTSFGKITTGYKELKVEKGKTLKDMEVFELIKPKITNTDEYHFSGKKDGWYIMGTDTEVTIDTVIEGDLVLISKVANSWCGPY